MSTSGIQQRGSAPTADAVVVVPCYNEAQRIRLATFEPFIQDSQRVRVLFVDDGSRDDTRRILHELAAGLGPRAEVLGLDRNGGKAEAVRRGMLHAIGSGARAVGFYDADGATPAAEMLALLKLLEDTQTSVAMASRVALLGRRIQRSVHRHYAGRVFATFASLVLGLPVYDTQCGAKFFRVSPLLAGVLEAPLTTRWAFDVELLARLLRGAAGQAGLDASQLVEMPLQAWTDVKGSKLNLTTYPQVFLELLRIAASNPRRG
jgi:dolichyl-phosphate beta-glucosyltransferase